MKGERKKDVSLPDLRIEKFHQIEPTYAITRFMDTDITATLCRTRISAIDKICYSDLSGLTLCSWQIMKMVQKLVSDDNLDDYLKLNFDPEVLRVLRWIALKQFVMLCILKIDFKPVS